MRHARRFGFRRGVYRLFRIPQRLNGHVRRLARSFGIDANDVQPGEALLGEGLQPRPAGRRALQEGTLVLYDVSSSYYTGRRSELVKDGYSRDGKPRRRQVLVGVVMMEGWPIAHHVFAGNRLERKK